MSLLLNIELTGSDVAVSVLAVVDLMLTGFSVVPRRVLGDPLHAYIHAHVHVGTIRIINKNARD